MTTSDPGRARVPSGVPTGGQFSVSARREADVDLSTDALPSREELLADPCLEVIPAELLADKTDEDLAAFIAGYRAMKVRQIAAAAEAEAAAAVESARRRRYRRPDWLHRHDDGHALWYTTDDGYRASAVQTLVEGRPHTHYCVRDPHGDEFANVDRVEQVQERIEGHRAQQVDRYGPHVPDSAEADVFPFGDATNLRDLERQYESATSPSNYHFDSDQDAFATEAEHFHLGEAYSRRRKQIDPDRAYAYCPECDRTVANDGLSGPVKHTDTEGKECIG